MKSRKKSEIEQAAKTGCVRSILELNHLNREKEEVDEVDEVEGEDTMDDNGDEIIRRTINAFLEFLGMMGCFALGWDSVLKGHH